MASTSLIAAASDTTANVSVGAVGSVSAGDLVILFVYQTGLASWAGFGVGDSDGGSYTSISGAASAKNSSADQSRVYVRDALIASGGSKTFTADWTGAGTNTGGGIIAIKVSGMNKVGSAAIRNAGASSNNASGTPAVALGGTALTTNPVLGFVFNATNPATLTPTASWTELSDTGYAVPATGAEAQKIDSGFTSSTVTWGGSSASAFGASAIELDAEIPTQYLEPTLHTNVRTFYAPTIVQILEPALLTNSQTIYPPLVSDPQTVLEPPLVTVTQTFYAPTLTSFIDAPLVTNVSVVYSPSARETLYSLTITPDPDPDPVTIDDDPE